MNLLFCDLQVVTAKVVAKAQSRNQRFGYVTMTTAEEARGCIKELSGTELKGRKITVEVVCLCTGTCTSSDCWFVRA